MPSSLGKAIINNMNKRKVERKIKNSEMCSREKKISSFITASKTTRNTFPQSETNSIEFFLSNVSKAQEDFVLRSSNDGIVILTDKKKDKALENDLNFELNQSLENLNIEENIQIVRRPKWNTDCSAQELANAEEEAFIDWKRQLALKFEESNLILTPYEKNLEIWRQLWRVVEKSDFLVQIVDGRNPLLFWSKDLFDYVKEVNSRKNTLLLVNKADLMNEQKRTKWKKFFEEQKINFVFFSALENSTQSVHSDGFTKLNEENKEEKNSARKFLDEKLNSVDILSADDLLTFFEAKAIIQNEENEKEENENEARREKRYVVGMVGYPNVGKSSIINRLFGMKRVGVGITPGKTRHFQTLNVNDLVQLCDCPGLVFPTLISSRAELICSGIISADHSRNLLDSAKLICRRVTVSQFLSVYRGVRLPVNSRFVSHERFLDAFALQKGWLTACRVPSKEIAARQLVKDYVSAKILYCFDPPGTKILSDIEKLPQETNIRIPRDNSLYDERLGNSKRKHKKKERAYRKAMWTKSQSDRLNHKALNE